MRTRVLFMLVAVGIFAATKAAEVHHSFALEYDVNAPIKLRGTIAKFEWINPHSWIHLDVKRPDGTVERWEIETGPPSGLVRRGFTKASVKVGTEVLIEGYRARNGGFHGSAQTSQLPDGRNLFAGSPGSPGADKQPEK